MPNDLAFNLACATIAAMHRLAAWTAVLLAFAAPLLAADDPLARARQLYNLGQFEQAINA